MTDFTVDKVKQQIHINREFAAAKDLLWRAWTQSEYIDKWWAPKPYVNKTKSMDFTEGGIWLYSMQSPEGEFHWSFARYTSISTGKSIAWTDGFCDSEGVANPDLPGSSWENTFRSVDENRSGISIVIQFESLDDLEGIIKMGFKEGMLAALENLDELFES